MEKGDIKEIIISTEKKDNISGIAERIFENEISIYDSLNEEEKKFIISIKFDMSNYLRMSNKNMTDIVFSIIITFFILCNVASADLISVGDSVSVGCAVACAPV